MVTNADVDCPAKNMQKTVVARNEKTANLCRSLTTTMQDVTQEEPERELSESMSLSEVQSDKDGEVFSRAPTPQGSSVPESFTVTSNRQLEELKILLQDEVHFLITRSLEEVKCLLQEEVHVRDSFERRLNERCDGLAEAVQAISSEHALQATHVGDMTSSLPWIKDRLDKLDINMAQVAVQPTAAQPQRGQEVLDTIETRITDLEESCKHLEMVGAAQTEIMERQKKCLEEYATVSATALAAHDRIDSLKAIVKGSFDRLVQESESVKLKSERVMWDEHSAEQMVNMRTPGSPTQQEQSADNVGLMVHPSFTPRVDCSTQQPIEQRREVAEASVIELPAQTARHISLSGKSSASRTSSSSLPWRRGVPSLNAEVVVASQPAPKPQSPAAGGKSASPRSPWAAQTPRGEHFRGSKSLPWPLPPQQQQLAQQQQLPQQAPQEQTAQPLLRPVGPTTSPATATTAREKSMDSHAAPVATRSPASLAAPAATSSTTTTTAALLARAASTVGTPKIQSPRHLPREAVRACMLRSPSADAPCAQFLAQPPERLRGSLGGSLGLVRTAIVA
jgi:hypothetical protein